MILRPYDTLSERTVPDINHVGDYSSDADNQAFNYEDQINVRDHAFNSEEKTNAKELVPGDKFNHEEFFFDDVSPYSNGNHKFLHDHLESKIIGSVNSRILTRNKAASNLWMFVNFVAMIEP